MLIQCKEYLCAASELGKGELKNKDSKLCQQPICWVKEIWKNEPIYLLEMLSSKFTWKYFQTAWKISTFMLVWCVFTWDRSRSGQVTNRGDVLLSARLLMLGILLENKYPWVFYQFTVCWFSSLVKTSQSSCCFNNCMAVKTLILYCNAMKTRTLPEKQESISVSRKELSHSLSRTDWSEALLLPRFFGFWSLVGILWELSPYLELCRTGGSLGQARAAVWLCEAWWVILPVTWTLPALLIGT